MQETKRNLSLLDLACIMIANIMAWSCMNIYIPCLPSVASDFHISEFLVKLTIVANIVGGIVGRIFWGPLSDNYGRRKLFLQSFNFSLIGIFGCYFSTNFYWFIFFRLIQGVGTGVTSVVTMSIISDLYSGVKRANLIGTVEMCWPIAWGIAPIFGAYCGEHYSWRISLLWLFSILFVLRFIFGFRLKETINVSKKDFSVRGMFSGYFSITRNKLFLIYALIPGFVLGGYMVFAVNAPFLYSKQFGYEPTEFAILQAIPLIVYFLTTFFYRFVIRQFGFYNACRFGIYVHVIFACFMLLSAIGTITASPLVITLLTCLQCLANGFLIPSGSTVALRHAPKDALGTASSVISLGRNLIVTSCFLISGLFEISIATLCGIILITVLIVLSLFSLARVIDYSGASFSLKTVNDDSVAKNAVQISNSRVE